MFKGLTCFAALCALAACTDGAGWGDEPGTGTGKIALATDLDASVVSARSSRTEYSDVTSGQLSLRLTYPDGSADTWGSVDDFPKDKAFKVGNYTLEAFYGNEDTEGFEAPYFYGKQQLKVEDQKTTAVSLTAQLANSMVEIAYTDEFKNYMTSYSAEVHSAGGAFTAYTADETRPVYVKAGNVTVSVDFVKPNGKGAKIEVAQFTAKPRTLHRLTVDLGGDGAGSSTIQITFDETLDEEAVDIDISDEVLNAPAPTVEPEGFTSDEAISFVSGLEPANTLKANIIARGGLKGVTLTTQSKALASLGWPAEIDLMSATAEQQQLLEGLGLEARGVYSTPDKLAVLDFTQLLRHIPYSGSGNNNTTIAIVAKDRGGKVSAPVTLSLTAEELSLSLDNAEIYVGGTTLYVNVLYNGGKPDGAVTVEYLHSRGVYSDAHTTFESLGNNVYRAKCTIEASTGDVKIRAKAGDMTTSELTVVRKPMVAANGPANVFAKKAYIPVTIGSQDSDAQMLADMMNAATVMVSTDGTNFTAATTSADPANKALLAEGLAPGTTYTAKIRNGSLDITDAPSFSFTTEAATQLPNAGMEEWSSDAHKSNMVEYHAGGWETYNPVTISQWESSANMSYNATSGTKETTDAVSGKAAIIRTVGWGSGNSASANAINQWSFGKCKHVSAGQLFLGNWNGVSIADKAVPNYGTAFNSRPAGISFNYKYSVSNRNGNDNGDFGTAEIAVVDATGNVIASQSVNLGIASSYTKKTLELSYGVNSSKASKLIVTFKSSGNPAALTANETYMKPPKPLNLSDGEYVGSQLYIDGIELIY